MMIIRKKFNELTTEELYNILKIRSEVFVVEQNCIYNDIDGKDLTSIHIMAIEDGEIKGYLRVLQPGVSYETASLGRVLVPKKFRGDQIARMIVQEGIDYVSENFEKPEITIGAQEYLREFYKSLGFKEISEVYGEDGIPHIDMYYKG